jgi:hypothetical protein
METHRNNSVAIRTKGDGSKPSTVPSHEHKAKDGQPSIPVIDLTMDDDEEETTPRDDHAMDRLMSNYIANSGVAKTPSEKNDEEPDSEDEPMMVSRRRALALASKNALPTPEKTPERATRAKKPLPTGVTVLPSDKLAADADTDLEFTIQLDIDQVLHTTSESERAKYKVRRLLHPPHGRRRQHRKQPHCESFG